MESESEITSCPEPGYDELLDRCMALWGGKIDDYIIQSLVRAYVDGLLKEPEPAPQVEEVATSESK